VSNPKLAQPVLAAALHAPCAEHIIGIDPLRQQQAGTLAFHDWASLTQGDPTGLPASLDAKRRAPMSSSAWIGREDLACIIYTSGTGGSPRGVRQHHGAILSNVADAATILAEDFALGDEQLSFLPLSHAYEHTGGQWLPIGVGARIAYAESPRSWPPISRKCGPRSWSSCRACSRSCACGSSSRSRSRGVFRSG
jgi:long-chain acyl-CoA synthetase